MKLQGTGQGQWIQVVYTYSISQMCLKMSLGVVSSLLHKVFKYREIQLGGNRMDPNSKQKVK